MRRVRRGAAAGRRIGFGAGLAGSAALHAGALVLLSGVLVWPRAVVRRSPTVELAASLEAGAAPSAQAASPVQEQPRRERRSASRAWGEARPSRPRLPGPPHGDPLAFERISPPELPPVRSPARPRARLTPLPAHPPAPAPPEPQPERSRPPSEAGAGGRGRVEAPVPHASNAPPRYPRLARRRGWEGRVLLRVEVGADGQVRSCVVIESSGHRVLDEAAREAVSRWCFEPARDAEGRAVAATIELPVRFRLR